MELLIGGACLALATTACAQQAPPSAGPAWSDIAPPAFMRYEPPTSGLIEARYDCFGKPVRMSLQVDRRSVRVLRYEDAAGRASDADLGRWNTWLADLDAYESYGFQCQREDNEVVSIRDAGGGRRPHAVVVYWTRGRLGRIPQAGEAL